MTEQSHIDILPISNERRRRCLWAASIGNALEVYDWIAYAIFARYFADQFFPAGNSSSALLGSLAIFAIGFFFRPLGGVVLAAFTDRHGRRTGLLVSVSMMGAGSLLIGVSPTYAQVGLLAPILLLVARIAQGLSVGGEFAASATYLTELAPAGKRGFYGSFQFTSVALGTLAATGLSTLLLDLVGTRQLQAWGWRIPFILGGLLAVYAWYLRRRLDETEVYLLGARHRVARPALEAIRRYPAQSLRVVGFTVGPTVAYYTFGVYLPVYAVRAEGMAPVPASWASIAAQVLFMAVLPFGGILSDHVGRRPMLISFGAGYVLFVVPLLMVLTSAPWTLLVVMGAGMLLFAFYGAVAPTAMAEMFPTEVRATGLGVPYAVTVALFGGTAPYLVEWFGATGRIHLFPWYIVTLCAVSLVVYLRSAESFDRNLTDRF